MSKNCDQSDELAKPTDSTSPHTPEKFPNRNIKERLNLHVKRRLQQESGVNASEQLTPPPLPSPIISPNRPSAFTPHSTSSTTTATPTKRGATSERGGTGSHCGGRGGKKSRNTRQSSSSVSSTTSTYPPDDECSRDGSSGCIELGRDKVHSPDILTTVLNQKKLSLFNDPEVVTFLDGIVGIIGKKSEESGCS